MNTLTNMNKKKRIAVVSHDNKKVDLINWAYSNKKVLTQHDLVATGSTGNILEGTLNTSVCKLSSRQLGGDQQLSALMAEGKLDVIIFFWDHLASKKYDNGINALVNKALMHNIVIACNRKTADFV